jgi:DeoR/GlpR family transcriptional regulator of sugar metabolism
VKSNELSEKLGVSEDTIRRDLKELSDHNKILKVHGGAMASNRFIPFSHQDREVHAQVEKVSIVKKAMSLIRKNQVILMDGGTTNLEFARLLPENLKLTVITNSIPLSLQLTQQPNVEIFFLGGKVVKNAQVTVGIEVIESLRDIRADLCFLGTRSIDPKAGITDINRDEVKIKRALMESAMTNVSLCLSEKLGTVQPYVVAPASRLDILITELPAQCTELIPYKNLGLAIK